MSYYTNRRQALDNATLDDLINYEHGSELADAALKVAIAFSAMPIDQIATACHHDYRLSGKLREAARKLSALIEEQANEDAAYDRENARDHAAFERGLEGIPVT